jgi:NADPH:quinone reductase
VNAIYIRQHGPISDLRVSDIPMPSVGPADVLVKVEAAGINPSDLVSVQGKFPGSVLPRVVGRDFAGKVEGGSADLIGTEVWGTGGDLGVSRDGTHAEYVVIPRQAIVSRPKNLSALAAAAVGVPFVTAFSALVRLGQVKEGEYVIVSGAAGSVGQAAIQIARSKAARVIALIRDSSERQAFKSGEIEAIAQSDKGDLNPVVREATNGRGADLAINAVGGNILGTLFDALAVGGRQVVFSAAGGREFSLDVLNFYKKQFALFGLDTQQFDVTHCAGILKDLAPLFESGALKPPPISDQYSLSEVVQAYSHVASGKGGKAVFVMATS